MEFLDFMNGIIAACSTKGSMSSSTTLRPQTQTNATCGAAHRNVHFQYTFGPHRAGEKQASPSRRNTLRILRRSHKARKRSREQGGLWA